MLQDLAVFLHAAQSSVDAQDTIHGVLDGNGLSRGRGRRKGGVGKTLRSSHEGHGQRNKKGRDHKQSEFSHGLLSQKGLSDFVLGRLQMGGMPQKLSRKKPEDSNGAKDPKDVRQALSLVIAY